MAVFKLSEVIGQGYNEWWTTRKFYRICKGSKGSKKTRTTALWFIWHMMRYPEANTLIIRRFKNTLEGTVYNDMLWAIDRLEVADEWKAYKSPLRLVHFYEDPVTHRRTQNVILFAGMDDPLKLAGSSVRHGYLCWVWFEEMYDITNENEFEKLVMSIRGKIPPETGLWKQITGTFNPWSENTWIKKRFFDEPAKNVFSMTTTYKCNEWLGEDDIERYEQMYIQNPRMARIVCDGEWGIAEGLVYENWHEEEFDPFEVLAENPNARPVFGLDFGFAISYNAFVAAIVDPKAKKVWIYDEMYERGMSNMDIARRITEMGYGRERITADSAEPKSIYELQAGLIEETFDSDGNPVYTRWMLPGVEPAMKGPDSVRSGIRRLQSFEQIVHPRCVNYKMELNNYCYDQDRDGNWLDKPIKEFDHCLVAGTMVLTDHGQVPIEDIQVGDMVMTHLGYMPVEAAGITQLEAEIWRLECEDGTILEGTGNHPVVTADGLKYIRDLSSDDEVIKWVGQDRRTSKQSTSSTEAIDGEDIPIPIDGTQEYISSVISMGRPNYCIGTSGKSTTVPSLKDAKSTMSMETLSTTTSPTSNASLSKPMLQSILGTMSAEQQSETACAETVPLRMHAESGTDLKRVMSGMSNTGGESWSPESTWTIPASTAVRFSRANLRANRSDSVPLDANRHIEQEPESISRCAFVQYAVRNSRQTSTGGPAPVPGHVLKGTDMESTVNPASVNTVGNNTMESGSACSVPRGANVCTTNTGMRHSESVQYAVPNSECISTVAQCVVPVRVVSCMDTGRRQVVYDLTVVGSHDFFANNLITLNCLDAMRMALDQVFVQARGHVVEAGSDRNRPSGAPSRRVVSSHRAPQSKT